MLATSSNIAKTNGSAIAHERIRFFSSSSSLLSKLEISKPAPDFAGTAVVKGDFKDIKLSDYKGKYVVLFFYPLDL